MQYHNTTHYTVDNEGENKWKTKNKHNKQSKMRLKHMKQQKRSTFDAVTDWIKARKWMWNGKERK